MWSYFRRRDLGSAGSRYYCQTFTSNLSFALEITFHCLEWEKTVEILESVRLLIFHLQPLEGILLSTHSSWCMSSISLACVQLACRDALWLWLSSAKLRSSWWAANSMWHERENSFHILLLITKWNVTQIIGAAQINDLDSILTLQSICTICDPTSVLLVESLLWQSKEKVFKSYLLLEAVGNVLLLIKFHQTQREYLNEKGKLFE